MSHKKTYDTEYAVTLRGFKVTLMPSKDIEGYYDAKIKENGAEVFKQSIPNIYNEEGDSEKKMLDNVANAAIDIYESSRGTLGMGAGAKQKKSRRVSMVSVYNVQDREEWYMQFKGTQYEPMAYEMLGNFIDLTYNQYLKNPRREELLERQREVVYELEKLDLERLKNAKANTKIIMIQGSIKKRSYIYDPESVKDFMAKFIGNPLESKVILLLKELMEIKEELQNIELLSDETYKDIESLNNQMYALQMEALQAEIEEDLNSRMPTEGYEAFPAMATDIAELMEGVSLEEPLNPMMIQSKKKAIQEERLPYKNRRREMPFYRRMRGFQDAEPVEKRIIDRGKYYETAEPAFVKIPKDKRFEVGDEVSLKKSLKPDNVTLTFPKGTKGRIESVIDETGIDYYVSLETVLGKRSIIRVPAKILKKS